MVHSIEDFNKDVTGKSPGLSEIDWSQDIEAKFWLHVINVWLLKAVVHQTILCGYSWRPCVNTIGVLL